MKTVAYGHRCQLSRNFPSSPKICILKFEWIKILAIQLTDITVVINYPRIRKC